MRLTLQTASSFPFHSNPEACAGSSPRAAKISGSFKSMKNLSYSSWLSWLSVVTDISGAEGRGRALIRASRKAFTTSWHAALESSSMAIGFLGLKTSFIHADRGD